MIWKLSLKMRKNYSSIHQSDSMKGVILSEGDDFGEDEGPWPSEKKEN